MSVATTILAKVEQGRWQKAVLAWSSGAYTVTVTFQDAYRVCGTVVNGDGKAYHSTISSEGFYACDCPDFLYRKGACKHVLGLCLHVTRPLQTQPQAEAH